ncbi:MAG TPA: BON domain-containing protein [Acidisarcina sp.]|nr:BON domain-containing protein [Acidisarcina sp.]
MAFLMKNALLRGGSVRGGLVRRAVVALALFSLPLFLSICLVSPVAASDQETAQASTRSDEAIERDVVGAITASPVLNVQPITATTVSGDVTLAGSVDDAASKELAQLVVSKVDGVRSVVNNLDIVPIGAPASNEPAPDNQQQQPAQQAQDSQQQPAQQDNQQQPAAEPSPTYPARRPPYGAPQQAPYPPNQANQDGPVQIPQGTLLTVRLIEPLDTKNLGQGAMFEVQSARDIYVGGALAIPRGATLDGQVVDIRSVKGSLSGSSSISLRLNTLVLEGRTYPLESDVWVSNGPGKGGYTAGNTIAGAGVGAVIGGIAGGGPGAAVGATVGGATGAVASSASSGPRVVLRPETVLNFHLAAPVTVVPVSYQEAQRLAASQPQQRTPYADRPGYPRPRVVYGYPYPYPYAYGYPYRYYYPRYRGYYRPYPGW